jgi:hypothetical protein
MRESAAISYKEDRALILEESTFKVDKTVEAVLNTEKERVPNPRNSSPVEKNPRHSRAFVLADLDERKD